MKDDWKNYEVLVSQEVTGKVHDGKAVILVTNCYMRPDEADLYQRLSVAITMLHGAVNEFIAVDKSKGLTDSGVELIGEFGLLGLRWNWVGMPLQKTARYETEVAHGD